MRALRCDRLLVAVLDVMHCCRMSSRGAAGTAGRWNQALLGALVDLVRLEVVPVRALSTGDLLLTFDATLDAW